MDKRILEQIVVDVGTDLETTPSGRPKFLTITVDKRNVQGLVAWSGVGYENEHFPWRNGVVSRMFPVFQRLHLEESIGVLSQFGC